MPWTRTAKLENDLEIIFHQEHQVDLLEKPLEGILYLDLSRLASSLLLKAGNHPYKAPDRWSVWPVWTAPIPGKCPSTWLVGSTF